MAWAEQLVRPGHDIDGAIALASLLVAQDGEAFDGPADALELAIQRVEVAMREAKGVNVQLSVLDLPSLWNRA